MRKAAVFGLVIVLAFSIPLFSQNKKGNFLIGTDIGGANLNFSSSQYSYPPDPTIFKDKSTAFGITVDPSIGYFLSDSIVAGAFLNLYFSSGTDDSSTTGSPATSTGTSSELGASLGPYLRIYFGDNNGKGMPYIQFTAGINILPFYSYKYTPSSGVGYSYKYDSYSSWNAGVEIGYEHYLNPHVGIEYYIGYGYSHVKQVTHDEYTNGAIYSDASENSSHGISFGVGLQIHLGGGK